MKDILVSDVIFWLQIFFLIISLVIFTKAMALRAKIRRLEKAGLIHGLDQVEQDRWKAARKQKQKIIWNLGYIRCDISDDEMDYCARRLEDLGVDINAVERLQLSPSVSITCEVFARKDVPSKSKQSTFTLFGELADDREKKRYQYLYIISHEAGDFQIPPIVIHVMQHQSLSGDFTTMYHGGLKYKKKKYDVVVNTFYAR